MKLIVEKNYTINGNIVFKEFESPDINIYVEEGFQIARIVNNYTDEIVASIYVNVDGGIGSLDVQSGL